MDKKFIISADVTCDISREFRQEYDIELIPGHFTTPDGKEHVGDCTWDEFDRETFYNELKKNPSGFQSSPASIEEFRLVFKKHAEAKEAVIAVCISGALSGTYSFMNSAKELVLREYPKAEIYICDSRRFGPVAGLMCVYLSELRKEGKSAKEAFDWLEENKNRFHQTGWMDDLSFVAKKGRITHAKAFFGTLIGIKPIGEFDYNGMTTVIGKGKGEDKTMNILLEYMARHIEEPEKQLIFIATSNEHKQAEKFKNLIVEKFHPKGAYVCDVYSNCGINIGPGLMAAYYYGKPISEGLVEESAAMKELLEN
ncbi:MAG: DegV family protein [Bacilli bacterium]|nr:DegV family protein [Bacilli bacterium]